MPIQEVTALIGATLSLALPSIQDVHLNTANTLGEAIRAEAVRRANLSEPVTKVVVDAPYYPGPILAIAYGATSRRAMTVGPVVAWRRGTVHLLLWLDGSKNWDYADHARRSDYGRHKPRWIDPSHEHLADLYEETRGEIDLVTAVDFADWWGLELLPLDEAAEIARRHCPSLG